MQYRAEIDGLRALAVVPVILFHAGFERFSGGYVGVDVFFVVSGYLITTIILEELEEGRFSPLKFYERRARRILPALFLVILVCMPPAWLLLSALEIKDFARSLIAVATFSSNLLFWRESGYFDTAAELKPLLHTWSIAVEEQYYILYPIFFIAFWKLGTKFIIGALILVFLASLSLAHWGAYNEPEAAFFLLPTRGWEILLGAFCAFHLKKSGPTKSSSANQYAGLLGLAFIAWSVFAFDETTPTPSAYTLIPTVGTALIILFANRGTLARAVLSIKPVVFVGLISYSLYLWHQPILVFSKYQSLIESSQLATLLSIVLTAVLSLMTWQFIEQPFRNKGQVGLLALSSLSVGFIIFFVASGLWVQSRFDKFESIWLSRQQPHVARTYKLITSPTSRARLTRDKHTSTGCRFNFSRLTPDLQKKLLDCREKLGKGTLILGDSHARGLFGVVTSRFENPFLVGAIQGGCRPHTPVPQCQYDGILKFVSEHDGVFDHVIYEQAGFYLLLRKGGGKGNRLMFRRLGYREEVTGLTIDREHVALTVGFLNKLSKYVPVTWFGPRLEPHIADYQILRRGCDFNYSIRTGTREVFDNLDSHIRSSLNTTDTSTVRIVSQNEAFEFLFPNDFMNCSQIYWSDGDHLSADGQRRFGGRLSDDFLEFGSSHK